MDLVDIDQVLDNLELREATDEHNKAVVQRQQLQLNAASNGFGAQSAAHKPASASANNKSFVGVSQVFNSLDDYCKNVESLGKASLKQYDEECRTIVATNSNANCMPPRECQPVADVRRLHDNVQNITRPSTSVGCGMNVTPKIESQRLQQNRHEPSDGEDDEDDQETSNDIHKFTEEARAKLRLNDDDEADDATTTSDSLTTSSASTFSSGPSLGLVSTTDEQLSAPVSPVVDEEQSALLANEADDEDADYAAGFKENNDFAAAPPNSASLGGALDDLACGLSSISLENVLDDLSKTTTNSLLSQLRDDADTQPKITATAESRSFVSATASYPEDKNVEKFKKCAVNEGHGLVECKPSRTKPKKTQEVVPEPEPVQPITFGSTMDEISDTELDSMLQEMDIDDVEDKQSDKLAPTEEVSELAKPVNTTQDDCMNADSFSQASTVEFSEIRAQSMQPVTPSVEEVAVQSNNSIASSYTSSESSLDGDALTNGDGDLEDSAGARPQRPTTLDLSALKMNLYAHAGQTPPGTQNAAEGVQTVPEPIVQQSGAGNPFEDYETQRNPFVDEGPQGDESAELPNEEHDVAEATGYSDPHANLGKFPPIWVPDSMAAGCMQCHAKFTMIKRRHHCRACGKVLCSVCCSQKFKLEFCNNPESRVCVQCYLILVRRGNMQSSVSASVADNAVGSDQLQMPAAATPTRSPNPNNPMEYCSTIPPHRQVSTTAAHPPSVIVPVGVLKKDGSYSSNSSNSSSKQGRKRKSVMFSDGIAPGSDLASMEHQWAEAKHARRVHQQGDANRVRHTAAANKPPTPVKTQQPITDATTIGLVAQLFRGSIPPMAAAAAVAAAETSSDPNSPSKITDPPPPYDSLPDVTPKIFKQEAVALHSKKLPPSGCDEVGCFIPKDDGALPPLYISKEGRNNDYDYKDVNNNFELMERLQKETLKFALQKNFYVYVKIINLKCCLNRTVINFTTHGMHHVGNDEIIILLEYEPPAHKQLMTEPPIPKEIFVQLYDIYREAELGNPIAELSFTSPREGNFLGSRDYGGFIFIRNSFQCLQEVNVPENPYLIGILIHRNEVPWAKVFPLRLMLRLGAQYRYYPCPHVSMRNRESVYAEIAQTIINFLADFRTYTYTLPCIRGMYIHMEDRQTTVMIPRNRQEDVIKAMNNSSDHILAFGGNFSKTADGHLVCMQNVDDDRTEMYSYSTQAINIQGQPRKVTGASFFVLNEALKSSSGLSGKCSIVEDGLMVQILPAKMEEVRNALRNQTDIDIVCGPIAADASQTEVVCIKWVENDREFNVGVKSPIDLKSMEGVSSMRVHASFNYANANYSIRLTDIYIIKFEEWYDAINGQGALTSSSADITRISEQIARATSMALVPFLDLLAASGNLKIGLRCSLHQDTVGYEAGVKGHKLPPLYMNALDNHLIPTLHNESADIEDEIVLEMIFYILNV